MYTYNNPHVEYKQMEAKEDIRSRINIEDVIGEYVQLKRAGRNFKGLSPFATEKSASFMVSPEKHIWHDFSSGKGGDIFSFVMEMEGVDFKGAMELLARKAGVDLSQYKMGDGSLSKKKDRLFEAADLAAKYYQQVLLRSNGAIAYLKKRGFNKQVIQDFKIGYSPNAENALTAALLKRGFTPQELRDAGLMVMRRHGPGDMFRNRIMVSLADPQGRVIGFTARILTDEPNAPKYINTPQTLLYDKSRHVFGLHLAKEAIRHQAFVVVVEGNMDVIASHQVDVKNVVATAGTALTEHHLRTLSRFTQDVRLSFDADKAGVAATERAISIASNLGITLGIIVLPGEAKDPDELIQQDVKLWQKAIQKPRDAVEWLLDQYASRYDLTSADGKRRATDQALQVVRSITDPVLLEHYLHKIGERVDTSLQALRTKLAQGSQPQAAVSKNSTPKSPTGPDEFEYQDHLLAMAWAHPEMRDSLIKLEPTDFMTEPRQEIAKHLKQNAPLLQSEEIDVKIKQLELIAEAKYTAINERHYFQAADIAKRIKRDKKTADLQRLKKAYNECDDDTQLVAIHRNIQQLEKEIEALKH